MSSGERPNSDLKVRAAIRFLGTKLVSKTEVTPAPQEQPRVARPYPPRAPIIAPAVEVQENVGEIPVDQRFDEIAAEEYAIELEKKAERARRERAEEEARQAEEERIHARRTQLEAELRDTEKKILAKKESKIRTVAALISEHEHEQEARSQKIRELEKQLEAAKEEDELAKTEALKKISDVKARETREFVKLTDAHKSISKKLSTLGNSVTSTYMPSGVTAKVVGEKIARSFYEEK